MKRYLLINTASDPSVVAVATTRKVLAETTLGERTKLSEQLLSRIDELLGLAKLTLDDLAGIGINIGPGPFTGLRIGIAVTNALAYSHQLRIVPVETDAMPSLLAFAEQVDQGLTSGKSTTAVLPHYGREPTITPPKKSGQ